MKMTMIAAAAGLGLGACAGQPASEDGAGDGRFDYAANFTCEGGSKLDVVFREPEGAVLARVDGGAVMTLAADPDATDGPTWKAEGTTLVVHGPGAMWTSGGRASPCEFQSRALPPPRAEGVTQTLMAADAGKAVDIKVGEKVAVALSGVPTAGYQWAASNPPAWVKASDGPSGSTTSAQYLPGFTGGNHWEVVIIEAVAAGEGEIVLAQRRPWESAAEPDAATFRFRLKAI